MNNRFVETNYCEAGSLRQEQSTWTHVYTAHMIRHCQTLRHENTILLGLDGLAGRTNGSCLYL
jgi:hypothetical protein